MKAIFTTALALFLTAGATAQTRVIPQNITWSIQPPNMAPEANYGGLMVNAIRVQVHEGPYTTPAAAALAVANQVMGDIANGRLAANGSTLCVILHGWGHNQITATIPANSPVRFFREEDRLPETEMVDSDFPDYVNNTESGNTSRTYRHPWLINATSSTAPLRVWTQQFISAYVALQQSSHPTLPDPSRFYVDSEEFILLPYRLDAVFMLHHLAGTSL